MNAVFSLNLFDKGGRMNGRVCETAKCRGQRIFPCLPASLALAAAVWCSSARASVVTTQTFTYAADLVLIDSAVTGTGDTFYNVPAGVTDPTLTVQPFAGNPSDLISFTVTYNLIYDVMHQNGPNGGGVTASVGGNIFMDNVVFTGDGNGTGSGGPPGDILFPSFSIVLSNTYLASDAGIS